MIILENNKIILKYEQKLKINKNKTKTKVYEYKEVTIPEDIYTYWSNIVGSDDLKKVYLYNVDDRYVLSPVLHDEYNVPLTVRKHGRSKTNSSKQVRFNNDVRVLDDVLVFTINPYMEGILRGDCFIDGVSFT